MKMGRLMEFWAFMNHGLLDAGSKALAKLTLWL